MTAAADPRTRFWIRATLVAGMLLAGLGLWAVLQSSPLGREDEPALAKDTGRHVRVVGPHGKPVPGAVAFVRSPGGDLPEEAEWHPEVGVLVLPEAGRDYAVRVTAPGHRIRDLPAVRGGQTLQLGRGPVARVLLRGMPETGMPEGVRVLMRVKPVQVEIEELDDAALVALMGNLGGPGSGPRRIPRGEFGYPISREQARAGIVLPAAGTYRIHWGLMDLEAGTWFSLGDRCGRDLEIVDRPEPQPFALQMTLDDLQETLDGLARGVETVRGK